MALDKVDVSMIEGLAEKIQAEIAKVPASKEVAILENTASYTGTASIPDDNTPPLIGEGAGVVNFDYAPSAVGKKILVEAVFWCELKGTDAVGIFSLCNGEAEAFGFSRTTGEGCKFVKLAGSFTSTGSTPVPISLRCGIGAGTGISVNRTDTNSYGGEASKIILKVTECE